jgi:hypothetical protein
MSKQRAEARRTKGGERRAGGRTNNVRTCGERCLKTEPNVKRERTRRDGNKMLPNALWLTHSLGSIPFRFEWRGLYDPVCFLATNLVTTNQFFSQDFNSFPVVSQNIFGAHLHPFEKWFGFILSDEMANMKQNLLVIFVSVQASASARIEDSLGT